MTRAGNWLRSSRAACLFFRVRLMPGDSVAAACRPVTSDHVAQQIGTGDASDQLSRFQDRDETLIALYDQILQSFNGCFGVYRGKLPLHQFPCRNFGKAMVGGLFHDLTGEYPDDFPLLHHRQSINAVSSENFPNLCN